MCLYHKYIFVNLPPIDRGIFLTFERFWGILEYFIIAVLSMDMSGNKQLTIAELEKQASLRDTFAQDTKQDDVHVDALHIQADERPELDPTIDFSTSDNLHYKEDPELHYWRWFLRLVTVTWVSVLFGVIAFFVYQYTYQISQPTIQSTTIKSSIDMIHE